MFVCECKECPYYFNTDCKKALIVINANGMCSQIYNENRSVKPDWNEAKSNISIRFENN